MDKALKQRLVGASVLIALAVIVLPMLLGGRSDGGMAEPEKIELPEKPPELSFETRRYPIGEAEDRSDNLNAASERVSNLPAPRVPAPEVLPADEAVTDIPDPAAADLREQEVVQQMGQVEGSIQSEGSEVSPDPSPTAAAAPVSTGSEPPEAVTGRYVVQVASFGASGNASKLSAKLEEQGYSVLVDSVKSDVGTLHRVRVGPYDHEIDATKAVTALESGEAGIRPRLVDLKPESAAQVTTPADPLVRWVVQVGSFSSQANADNLVASLRLKGLSTYQETITSSGAEIYRVRVGPFLERQEAIRIESQLRSEMSLSGVVMSAE
jgi:DedD protein